MAGAPSRTGAWAPWGVCASAVALLVTVGAIAHAARPALFGLDPVAQVVLAAVGMALLGTALFVRGVAGLRVRAEMAEKRSADYAAAVEAVAVTAHELKQPLTALRAYVQWMDGRALTEAQLRLYCKDMLVACDEMDAIVRQLELVARFHTHSTSRVASLDAERLLKTIGD